MSSKIDVQGAIYGADRTGVIWEVTMQTLDAFTPDQLKECPGVQSSDTFTSAMGYFRIKILATCAGSSSVNRAYDYPVRKYADVIRNLRMIAPVVDLCRDPDLIAVNNGVFNYQTKELLEFSPDMVYASKALT